MRTIYVWILEVNPNFGRLEGFYFPSNITKSVRLVLFTVNLSIMYNEDVGEVYPQSSNQIQETLE